MKICAPRLRGAFLFVIIVWTSNDKQLVVDGVLGGIGLWGL